MAQLKVTITCEGPAAVGKSRFLELMSRTMDHQTEFSVRRIHRTEEGPNNTAIMELDLELFHFL